MSVSEPPQEPRRPRRGYRYHDPLESSSEARLYDGVKDLGGMCIKMVPIKGGVPDRLILLPGGRVFLIEMKKPGGRLRPLQEVFHARAKRIDAPILVLTGHAEVDQWLAEQAATMHQHEGEDLL